MKIINSVDELKQLVANSESSFYQYGLGVCGEFWHVYFIQEGIMIEHCVDRNEKKICKYSNGISVQELFDSPKKEKINILLTVRWNNVNSIKEILEKNNILNIYYLDEKIIPDEEFLRVKYKMFAGKELNLEHPISANEKFQWYKLYYHDDLFTKLVDKYEVKSYIKEKIGEEYIIPAYGVWESFDDIDFESLPDEFVLKCTHDSGSIKIVDKHESDIQELKEYFEPKLETNYYYSQREWAYKNVTPRIMAEKYMPELGRKDSVEYKIISLYGKVKVISICTGIAHASYDVRFNDYYDRELNELPFYINYKKAPQKPVMPKEIDSLIELTEKLSDGIPEVRVDWYILEGKIVFGEFTFYTWAGFNNFTPPEWDEIAGGWFELPEKKV